LRTPLWGAPKIHGELLKLGIEVAQSTVSIYMVSRRDRPLQTWKPSFAIIWRGLRRLISLWFRRLPLSNCSRFLFSAIDGERVLADIDSDHGNGSVEFLRHRVLLAFGAPCWLRLLEHGRTIPLADLIASRPPSGLPPLCR